MYAFIEGSIFASVLGLFTVVADTYVDGAGCGAVCGPLSLSRGSGPVPLMLLDVIDLECIFEKTVCRRIICRVEKSVEIGLLLT
ncbi:16078_t:CDS:2, partial [Gigaspora rosea]